MKKVLTLFLSALLLCGVTSCGKTAAADNAIRQYADRAYTYNGVSVEDDVLTVLLTAPDRSDYVQVSVPLTQKESDAYDAVDIFAEDYEQQMDDFLFSLSGEMTVTELNDRVPTEDELRRFVGMTLGELEEAGYEQTSACDGDDGTVAFIYSDEEIELMVYPEGEFKDLFSYADVDLQTLAIARVQFYGFW